MHLRKKFVLVIFLMASVFALHAQQVILREDALIDQRSGQTVYRLPIRGPGILTIEVVSLDFRPEVELVLPDGSSELGVSNGRYAQLSRYTNVNGQIEVLVSAPEQTLPPEARFSIKLSRDSSQQSLRIGQSLEGSLANSDSIHDGSKFVDWYGINLPASGRVEVSLSSQSLDTFLLAYLPNGELLSNDDHNGSDSFLRIRSNPGDTVLVGATSFAEQAQGPYTIAYTESAPLRQLSLGRPADGNFADEGEPAYGFTPSQPGRYVFTLSSDAQSPYLRIVNGTGRTFESSGYEDVPARLSLSLEAGREVEVILSDYDGNYRVQVERAPAVEPLVPDQPYTGFLSEGESVRFSYRAGDEVELLRVYLDSMDFDTFLELIGSEVYLENDDEDVAYDGYSSVINYEASPGEELEIVVSGFGESDSGLFNLNLSAVSLAGISEYLPGSQLRIGESRTHAMQGSGHEFSLYLEQGQEVEIFLGSESFDTYLDVSGPDGQSWYDDDSGGDLDSLLTLVAPVAGEYIVYPRAFSSETASGIYTLSVREYGSRVPLLDEFGFLEGPSVEFSVSLEVGSNLVVEAQSDDFDTYLTLYDEAGDIVAENDDGGGGTNSALRFVAAEAGEYYIELRPYSQGGTGEFYLQAFQRPE